MPRTTSKRGGRKSSGGSSMKKLWEEAKQKAKEDSFGEAIPLDVGSYRMQLVSADIQDIKDHKTLLTKWAVLDEDDAGEICTNFQRMDTVDEIVWVQRLMISLGFDIDSVDPDEDSDVLEAFNEAIKEGTVAKVKVIEKDGYTNMRIGKADTFEDDELFEPKDVLKPKKSGKDKSSSRNNKKDEVDLDKLEEELADMSKAELKKYIKDEDLDVSVTRKMTEDEVIDAILDALE